MRRDGIRKTFKRETALLLLTCLMGFAVFAMMPADPSLVTARATIVTALAFPILSFAAVAFGMDWAGKQTSFGRDVFDEQALDMPAASSQAMEDDDVRAG